MKKSIILTVCSIFLILGLTGCKSEEMQSFTFDSGSVSGIEIETGAAPVSVVKDSGDTIEISYTQDVADIQDGVLKINIPMPKAGINVKKQTNIIVSVPRQLELPIQIKSEVGDINVENVNASKLTIDAEYGNIILTGIDGHIMAKSEMDVIKTDFNISSEIKSLGSIGQELDAQLGESENEISLYTNTGSIELK